MFDYQYHKLKLQAAMLNDILREYPTSSVANALTQITSRIKHIEQNGKTNQGAKAA